MYTPFEVSVDNGRRPGELILAAIVRGNIEEAFSGSMPGVDSVFHGPHNAVEGETDHLVGVTWEESASADDDRRIFHDDLGFLSDQDLAYYLPAILILVLRMDDERISDLPLRAEELLAQSGHYREGFHPIFLGMPQAQKAVVGQFLAWRSIKLTAHTILVCEDETYSELAGEALDLITHGLIHSFGGRRP